MQHQLEQRIKIYLSIFITALFLSGISAFPLEWELKLLKNATEDQLNFSNMLYQWISQVYHALHLTNLKYPFLAYGTDWLAFAHLLFAILFIGPLVDPVKNIWVIQFGMIACLLIIPLALIAGPVRDIPFFWRIIDCSFGLLGFIPLYLTHQLVQKLVSLRTPVMNE